MCELQLYLVYADDEDRSRMREGLDDICLQGVIIQRVRWNRKL